MLKMYHDTVQPTPTTNDLRLLAPIPRILVVDADDDTRELYRQSFQLSGYHVVEASDGRDALTKALVSPPNLVVTEIRLPFLDGYALCEILRRDRATADIPILVLTAVRPTDMDRARRAGADIVVAKPTTPDHIVSLSRRLLDEVKGLRGHAAAIAASATAPSEMSEGAPAHFAGRRRTVLVKAHSPFTTSTPATPPASLMCPSCDRPLAYDRSHIGGVNDRQREQWDYYRCLCGAFQYRQRTRKLRHVDSVPQRTTPKEVERAECLRLRAALTTAIKTQLLEPGRVPFPLLNDPKMTSRLIKANAVIGLAAKGEKVGVTCALCHTITDGSAFMMQGGGSIGHRQDGRTNHNLNLGKILATAANSRAWYGMSSQARTDEAMVGPGARRTTWRHSQRPTAADVRAAARRPRRDGGGGEWVAATLWGGRS